MKGLKLLNIIWKVIMTLGMTVLAVFLVVILMKLYDESALKYRLQRWMAVNEFAEDNYFLWKGDNKVCLVDYRNGKRLTPWLDRIYNNRVKDSLTVFFKDGKRGFLNIYTGKMAIPARYEKAWVFSEGVGAVMMDGKIGFIDKSGTVAIPFNFVYKKGFNDRVDFLFKGGSCTVIDSCGKCGLIDHSGNWVVAPVYDYINNPVRHLRIVRAGGRYGVLDASAALMLPAVYDWVEITNSGIIVVDGEGKKLLDHTGKNILQKEIYDNISYLSYSSTFGEDDSLKRIKSDYWEYEISGRKGILSPDFKPITKAIYTCVKALDQDHFICTCNGHKIIIDGKGNQVSR